MSRFNWPSDREAVVAHFQDRHPSNEGHALLNHAFYAVDALHYLAYVDASFETTRNAGDHDSDVVDVAHARWAASTAITALDLVAAAFGRCLGNHRRTKELDFGSFTTSKPSTNLQAVLDRIPLQAKKWISNVQKDSDFHAVSEARDALIHRRLPRTLYMSFVPGIVAPRLELNIGGSNIPAGELVMRCRDFTTRHLVELLKILPAL